MAEMEVSWQASPSRRGTATLIVNCLFTILACTWSIQHPNVPARHETLRHTLPRRIKWAVFTLFFPEFLMAHAILEFAMAMEDLRGLEEVGHFGVSLPWFVRWYRQGWSFSSTPMPSTSARALEDSRGKERTDGWTLTHCYFANMGGFYVSDDTRTSSPRPKNHLLTAYHFVKYWKYLDIPTYTDDDLNDKSKTDYFTRAIAVIQIAQLILSLIFRKVQRLAFSQLETLTVAFAICGILTYICYWYKPQDVRRPIQVNLAPSTEKLPVDLQERTFDGLWQVLMNSKRTGNKQPVERIPNDNVPKTKRHETHYALYLLTVLTAGFGSIHAIAWNFEFPTFIEQTIWRVATLVSTILPPVALLTIPLAQIVVPWGESSDFRAACLDAMREYSWRVPDNGVIRDAMATLQKSCGDAKKATHSHYQEILHQGGEGEESLGRLMLEYIQQNDELRCGLPHDFILKFSKLLEILESSSSSKRLWGAARTDTYPQRSLFGTFFNDGIIYTTSIAYCLARTSVIGVAFSSLRLMPDSVYVTPWTENIPSIR